MYIIPIIHIVCLVLGFCLFVCFELHEQFVSYLAAVTITDDKGANLDLCLTLTAFNSKGSFTCQEAITTYFKRLRLTRPTRARLELTTLCLLSESTTIRLTC